jgi:hypothetical protein
MDSETLRFFLRVLELGSFGRAAQVLRRIALLEREVRAQLFVSHQRGVSLTANEHAAAVIVSGMPRSLMVSSLMIPSVPSAPTNRWVRS